MISPNRPSTELKISMTRIFTNLTTLLDCVAFCKLDELFKTYKLGSAASASAALLPFIPTDTPQIRLHIPTVKPAQNSA